MGMMRRAGMLALAVLATTCVATEEEPRDIGVIHQPLRVCAGPDTLDGIDVSYWQGEIDWDSVAGSGISFAFIRVGDGLFEDPRFDENWSEARRVGVVRGVYQFFRPGTDPIEQAEILIRRMGPLEPGDLPPVIDVEATDGQSASVIIARMHEWLDHVEGATGRVPIIYTAKYFWQDNVAASGEFLDHPLWVAHWEIDCPNTPDPWTEWVFWQTSDSGSVPGISGAVDTNLFDGDWEALMDFASGEAVCGDGHCTGDETHETCPEDCPVCDPVPPLGRIVDETEICFEAGGPSDSWWSESAGWSGSLMWTYATDVTDRENYGVWHLEFEAAGTYRLEVYTDALFAASLTADYEVHHAGLTDGVELDQTAVDGWQLLGEFEFAEGGDQWVHLPDNTGEPLADHLRVVYDAISLERLDPPADEIPDEHADVDEDGHADVETDDAGLTDVSWPGPDTGAGCGCSTAGAPAPPAPLAWIVVIVLAAFSRRRPV